MSAQGVHAAARHPNIAQQKLNHRHGADVLRAVGVLRPAEGIQNCACFVGRGHFAPCLGYFEEIFFAGAANGGHHIQRVAGIMFFHHLEHAARMLQRGVGLGVAVFV